MNSKGDRQRSCREGGHCEGHCFYEGELEKTTQLLYPRDNKGLISIESNIDVSSLHEVCTV